MNRVRRVASGALRAALYSFLVGAIVLVGVELHALQRQRGFERANIAHLRGALSFDRALSQMDGLGTVLGSPEGPWVAIAYRDSHNVYTASSSAVARMSDGRWFRSNLHYCAEFVGYMSASERLADAAAQQGITEAELAERRAFVEGMKVWPVDRATNADDMAAALRAIGFREMPPPK